MQPASQLKQSFYKKVGRYTLEREIGKGSFATVYYGRDTKGTEYAFKVIPEEQINTQAKADALESEMSVLMSAKHENMLQFYDIFKSAHYYYIVFEYCERGSLLNFFQSNPCIRLGVKISILRDIVNGYKYLYSNCVIHRDIKLENFLVKKREEGNILIKFGDFGLAQIIDNKGEKMTDLFVEGKCGSVPYMAPEVLEGSLYNYQADIYSIGICACLLFFHDFPFKPPEKDSNGHLLIETLMTLLKYGAYAFKVINPVPRMAVDFITKCLQKHTENRFHANDMVSHPLFTMTLSELEKNLIQNGVLHANLSSFDYSISDK